MKSDVFQMGLVFAEMFTGANPLKPCKKILDPVELDPLIYFGGSQASSILTQISRMLEYSVDSRPHASDLLDPWEGIFREVVTLSHQLEGRVF